ncbi:hypothetical protein QYM36_019078 [Artemia franciscana]|uniref:Endonuclease/exonuclease/phosphatase domain-containing protein n=1 Tax=Artemia franciscana TaxID=6661 RepID=A0AA88H8E5_ARTSF|nr:hypothetical protein QYM36_019078 [Artemia franciscana]
MEGSSQRAFHRQLKRDTRTSNVRTLAKPGILDLMVKELEKYRWDLIGLCETRLPGIGEQHCSNITLSYCNKSDGKHRQGVGFLLTRKSKPDEEGDTFNQQLHSLTDEIPKKHVLILMGDFNAIVGEVTLLDRMFQADWSWETESSREIKEAICSLKDNKAHDLDGIPVEQLKVGSPLLEDILHKVALTV